MAKNYFILNSNQDLEKAYQAIILWFKGQLYEVEGIKQDTCYLIQARKTGTIRTLLGSNLAFKIKIYLSSESLNGKKEFVIETGRGKWIQNIAGASFASIFTAGLTIWTGIAMAGWGLWLENQLISYLEKDTNFTRVKPEEEGKIKEVNNTDYVYEINIEKNSDQQQIINELQAEIDKLEIAFTDEILTEEEFVRKKAILEKQLDDYEVNLLIEEKVKKLQDAFSQGILDQIEYEKKVHNLEANVREKFLAQRKAERNKTKIVKLKEALKNGIITQQEFDRKIAQLS
ncbi:SHOCT domain-containing protein [Cyanobacterium sp. DS4]|uniref:SHOCT domain-containing protein n=1 Tax=Cyanobacterium sp. DS4 TaxID=2878255 RepID=UPI002E82110C|nr:SHOCT domain-containing protein [Cyanobacterium sp. Dongsha4]WVL01095.1 SHOCT domain-containing protein [Cyanobacterium sp. Dongsha4]